MTLFNATLSPAPGRPRPAVLAVGAALVVAIIATCAALRPEWRQNPDLSHGFFAPLVFALLVWESRRTGPPRWLRPGAALGALQLALAAAAVAVFVLAGLFAAAVGWTHALVLFLLALALACLLLTGLAILADERIRLVPCNWIALTAVLLWVLVAPLPTGTYARLTLALQGWVTGGVMEALQFLGIPARQHGNVIELAHVTVGVEEACSGVRSLISCVYAGFFFAAWLVRRPARRVGLILLAPALALVMNFVRSLILTLLANRGTDIAGAWHDATGFAILGLTAALLAGTALWLETDDRPAAAVPVPATEMPVTSSYRTFWSAAALLVALAIFFHVNSRPTAAPPEPAPVLTEMLPAAAPGWEVVTAADLYQFSGILQTTHLLQRSYLRREGSRGLTDLTVYIAYWPPGQTSVSRVASHTPDACWPGSGWIAQAGLSQHRWAPPVEGVPLAPGEYRFFRTEGGHGQHVWFWHIFDGRVIGYQDPYSLPALLQIALKYGFRHQGSQYFIRISSNRPWEEIAREPVLRQILANLQPAGL